MIKRKREDGSQPQPKAVKKEGDLPEDDLRHKVPPKPQPRGRTLEDRARDHEPKETVEEEILIEVEGQRPKKIRLLDQVEQLNLSSDKSSEVAVEPVAGPSRGFPVSPDKPRRVRHVSLDISTDSDSAGRIELFWRGDLDTSEEHL